MWYAFPIHDFCELGTTTLTSQPTIPASIFELKFHQCKDVQRHTEVVGEMAVQAIDVRGVASRRPVVVLQRVWLEGSQDTRGMVLAVSKTLSGAFEDMAVAEVEQMFPDRHPLASCHDFHFQQCVVASICQCDAWKISPLPGPMHMLTVPPMHSVVHQ